MLLPRVDDDCAVVVGAVWASERRWGRHYSRTPQSKLHCCVNQKVPVLFFFGQKEKKTYYQLLQLFDMYCSTEYRSSTVPSKSAEEEEEGEEVLFFFSFFFFLQSDERDPRPEIDVTAKMREREWIGRDEWAGVGLQYFAVQGPKTALLKKKTNN